MSDNLNNILKTLRENIDQGKSESIERRWEAITAKIASEEVKMDEWIGKCSPELNEEGRNKCNEASAGSQELTVKILEKIKGLTTTETLDSSVIEKLHKLTHMMVKTRNNHSEKIESITAKGVMDNPAHSEYEKLVFIATRYRRWVERDEVLVDQDEMFKYHKERYTLETLGRIASADQDPQSATDQVPQSATEPAAEMPDYSGDID